MSIKGIKGIRFSVFDETTAAEREWFGRAQCRDTDLLVFFPLGAGENPPPKVVRARTAKAKDICSMCPVRNECLSWALVHNERYGIWGGRTEDERAALRRSLMRRGLITGQRPA